MEIRWANYVYTCQLCIMCVCVLGGIYVCIIHIYVSVCICEQEKFLSLYVLRLPVGDEPYTLNPRKIPSGFKLFIRKPRVGIIAASYRSHSSRPSLVTWPLTQTLSTIKKTIIAHIIGSQLSWASRKLTTLDLITTQILNKAINLTWYDLIFFPRTLPQLIVTTHTLDKTGTWLGTCVV